MEPLTEANGPYLSRYESKIPFELRDEARSSFRLWRFGLSWDLQLRRPPIMRQRPL